MSWQRSHKHRGDNKVNKLFINECNTRSLRFKPQKICCYSICLMAKLGGSEQGDDPSVKLPCKICGLLCLSLCATEFCDVISFEVFSKSSQFFCVRLIESDKQKAKNDISSKNVLVISKISPKFTKRSSF